MPVIETPSVFSGITVAKAMRRQVVDLPLTANIGRGIRMMIRYKVNAVLLTDNGVPYGVLALSDSARFRSGSCRACTAGRILTG